MFWLYADTVAAMYSQPGQRLWSPLRFTLLIHTDGELLVKYFCLLLLPQSTHKSRTSSSHDVATQTFYIVSIPSYTPQNDPSKIQV